MGSYNMSIARLKIHMRISKASLKASKDIKPTQLTSTKSSLAMAKTRKAFTSVMPRRPRSRLFGQLKAQFRSSKKEKA